MIPDSDLALWKELSEKATAGPWHHVAVRHMQHEVFTAEDRYPYTEGECTIHCWHDADAAFIAASRSAVSKLIEEVERLTALNDLAKELEIKRVTLINNLSGKRVEAEADRDRLRALLDRCSHKLGYLLRDYPGDKETRGLIESIRAELGEKP